MAQKRSTVEFEDDLKRLQLLLYVSAIAMAMPALMFFFESLLTRKGTMGAIEHVANPAAFFFWLAAIEVTSHIKPVASELHLMPVISSGSFVRKEGSYVRRISLSNNVQFSGWKSAFISEGSLRC